jgi:hypothetical protein
MLNVQFVCIDDHLVFLRLVNDPFEKEVLGVNNAAQAVPKQLGEKHRRPYGTMVNRGVDY